jgi:hypothetical protein
MAISLVAPSNATMLVAAPAPMPVYLVGVLTLKKTISASETQRATSVEKKRLDCRAGSSTVSPPSGAMVAAFVPSRATRTISFRPGSWIGGCCEFHLRILAASLSTTVTRIPGFWKAMTAAVGPPVELLVRLLSARSSPVGDEDLSYASRGWTWQGMMRESDIPTYPAPTQQMFFTPSCSG